MNKIVRACLLIAALYCAGSYYLDRPEEVERDVAALRDMADRIPEPEVVIEKARATGDAVVQRVSRR